jgi:hypothetical protein
MATGLVSAVAMWGFWGPALTAVAILIPILSVALLAGVRAWQASVRISVGGSLALVACAGLVGAFRWSGAIVVVALVATSPVIRTLLLASRAASGSGRAAVGWEEAPPETDRVEDRPTLAQPRGNARTGLAWLEELPGADAVPSLDDEALCRAWRRSYLQLDAGFGGGRRLAVVRLREAYLDEMTRRHPAEVQLWFASGARAAGNPLPFLRRPVSRTDSGEPADEAWPDPE